MEWNVPPVIQKEQRVHKHSYLNLKCIMLIFALDLLPNYCLFWLMLNLFAFSELTLVGGEGHALEIRGDHQVETRRTTPPWEDRHVDARAPS